MRLALAVVLRLEEATGSYITLYEHPESNHPATPFVRILINLKVRAQGVNSNVCAFILLIS